MPFLPPHYLLSIATRSKRNYLQAPSPFPLKRIGRRKRNAPELITPLRSSRKGLEAGARNPTKCASNTTGSIAVRSVSSARPPKIHSWSHREQQFILWVPDISESPKTSPQPEHDPTCHRHKKISSPIGTPLTFSNEEWKKKYLTRSS